jgi:hypothetical protein
VCDQEGVLWTTIHRLCFGFYLLKNLDSRIEEAEHQNPANQPGFDV